jgi:UDP-N-acetylglucosamine 2-epimerase (non-hydrolysing)
LFTGETNINSNWRTGLNICIAVGTRPEIIKMSPVVQECDKRGLKYFILHTGQHYSPNMDSVFFEQLGLPAPRYNLHAGSDTDAKQIAKIMLGTEDILLNEKPSVVLVEGDTSSVLACALTALKMKIPVGHVEAGLRSFDRTMPEETNRIIVDHFAQFLFAPTTLSRKHLLQENISADSIYVTGNTIVDVVKKYCPAPGQKTGYMLATIHRQENVDNPDRFRAILKGLDDIYAQYQIPVIYPMHPRSRKMLEKYGYKTSVKLIDPLDYLQFLEMESNATLIITDSGGVQEEACILNVPCVTVRDNTERQETIEAGANILAGTSPEKILACAKKMLSKKNDWKQPYGDGKTAGKIIDIIVKRL